MGVVERRRRRARLERGPSKRTSGHFLVRPERGRSKRTSGHLLVGLLLVPEERGHSERTSGHLLVGLLEATHPDRHGGGREEKET